MPRDVARASLYRSKINLWVEDETTRSYLAELWSDPDVGYLVGGGNEGVKAVVAEAEQAGYPNVFAVVDRDYLSSNIKDWSNPTKKSRRFIAPVHEVENYLLDAPALAASVFNNRGLSTTQIDDLMAAHAGRLTWWAACRAPLAELRHRFRDGFPSDPKYPAVDREEMAVRHILDHEWCRNLAGKAARSGEAEIRALVAEKHAAARDQLADGGWRTEFAGKEILRDVGSRFVDWTRPGMMALKKDFESDLAKEVAAWQRVHGAVPADLTRLLEALKLRIARPAT